jgi:hypothetical protein
MNGGRSIAAHIAVAEIVGVDEDDIGIRGRLRCAE